MEYIKDLGLFTVGIDRRYNTPRRARFGLFKCPHCGKEYKLPMSRGKIQKSCIDCRGIDHRTVRHANRKLAAVWQAMKQRCNNPNNPKYHIYGGRGIKVCDRWMESFENFYEDNKDKYKDGLTIDRIDSNGDYCPENVQWVTKSENSSRTSKRRPVNQYRIIPDQPGKYVFLKKWDSAQQAGESLGIIPYGITMCCKKKTKSAYKYYWEYVE